MKKAWVFAEQIPVLYKILVYAREAGYLAKAVPYMAATIPGVYKKDVLKYSI